MEYQQDVLYFESSRCLFAVYLLYLSEPDNQKYYLYMSC